MIPLAVFALEAQKQNHRRSCVKIMAFLGRYGHQPLDTMMHTPITLLAELANEVAELMENERDQFQQAFASGGGG